MDRAVLCRPFAPEQVRQREGQGGRIFSYVEVHTVIARLNEGVQEWSFEVLEHHILEEEVIVMAKLTADGVVKTSFGGSALTREKSGRTISIADDLKAAASDSLKKSASLLGVGLELYASPPTTKAASSAGPSTEVLTDRQLDALRSVARKKNIGRGRFVALLNERFKKTEVRQLSRREASSLLSELTKTNDAHP